ncbi:unnamed protein product [Brassica rapa]|uniref:Uncharacterized protein n=1 Tax=Brassica campestris TaxID=3711 RepID=A0A3P5XZW6_BRACM|nr:unnamed protein product [Brassica rapa]CAG7862115.1 unnamed protein product [Brassica rapa]VDC60376.1 unnamed protein product [Brassica rapa]
MLLFILSPFQARDLMAISSIKLDGLSLILATIAGGGYVSDVVRMPPYICSVFPYPLCLQAIIKF